LVTVRRNWAIWTAPVNSVQLGTAVTLIVRLTRRPWSVVTVDVAGTCAQGSFFNRL
jgi:hypothetical protein